MSVCAALLFAGCTTDGQAVGNSAADLSDRAVLPADFPVPGATRVPETAVPFALAGVSGNDPAVAYPVDCAPPPPSAAGAVVTSVIVASGSTSYTSAIARVHDGLAALLAQAGRCPETRTGGQRAGSIMATRIQPAPPAPTGVDTAALQRTVFTGDLSHSAATSSLTLLGQRDDVRVYAQYRWAGDGAIDPSAARSLDALFTKAVAAAF
ncbi:hypothetical protein LH935_11945 [Gordonia polyisoprenivorans]|uniref:hypothetical protein n=1 Tax=Gordonia polyisoprenivorans TaxID=84595 RepID=UPI001B34FDE6|nr:hypothetical protein LH935_11945 [Gordonia polyisoprenivorans]